MQGRHIQLFNRLDALEIIHRTPNDSTKSILILDEEDHVDINNLHDKNIEYNTLLNVCYTVCKTLKENIRFVYLPLSKSLFDKAWPKLIKKEWKGICFTSDILSFGLANPLSDVIGCFFKAEGHKCVLSVPLKGTLGTFTKGSGGPNTLGFFLKDLVQIASKPFHSLAPIKEPTIRMINTLDKFKKFIGILRDLKIVSIDTETSGLNRITSPLLMVQFAVSNELCYCLPMSGHNESPWNDKELRYIKKYLRNYFSTTKSLHIMHAASFDIGQLMHHFNVKYYSADIYDTIAGEFLIDEQKKFLRTKSFKPYALETVELEYGLIRPKGLIEKDQRKNMAAFSLGQIAEYGSYDVITLFDIRERQLQSCIHKLVGYKSVEEYERTVIKQVGVMNRVFSTMQNNGMEINVDYLMELVSPVGPLENQKKEIIKNLFTLPSVLKLNRRLKKRAGHSENTLFGDEVRLFNINKPAHKHELFFDILNLEPVSFGKSLDENGEPRPSTDKAFQAHYAKEVPEVAALTDYNKVTKLKSAFADAIMERIIQDSDFIEDGRLRSSYGFSSVLSGRCIHKDSMVAVLDDRQNVPIKDIKVGDWVWSYNFDTLRPEPKQVLNVYDNGKRPTIKIKYTKKHPKGKQNKFLICTPDHKIGILNKSYKKAEDLDYGDRLIAFERFYKEGYSFVTGSSVKHLREYVAEHRLAKLKNINSKKVVHHKDENKLNNVPSNLARVSSSKHSKIHYPDRLNHLINVGENNHMYKELPDNIEELFSKFGSAKKVARHLDMSVGVLRKKLNAENIDFKKLLWSTPDYVSKKELISLLIKFNGQITSIIQHSGYCHTTIIKYLRFYNIDIDDYKTSVVIDEKTLAKIGEALDSGIPASKVAVQFNLLFSELRSHFFCDWKWSYKKCGRYTEAMVEKAKTFSNVKNVAKYLGVSVKEATLLLSSDNNHTYKDSKNNGIAHVYDIEVEGNHNFFANGILVHNCNAFNINPQQIPSRGPLAKVIKKLFKSKLGRVLIASDFSAHEVRIGGIVSRDPMVAKVFNAANEAIREFRLKKILPEEYAAAKELLERKGDIHIMNVKFFFGLDIDKKHVLRDQIKSVVFGVLYGKMAKNLAKAMGIEEEEAQALLDKLFENWSGVKKWIDHVHETANETFMVHYPNHRVRHMWGYLSSDKWVHFAMNRRAVNSPIQGFASDIGVVAIDELNRWIHENIWLRDYQFDFQTINMIHDAQYNETAFESLPLGVYLTEHAMSSLPMDYYKREFGYKISVPLGYDLDFGLNWADLKEWDKRAESLFDMIGKLGQETGKDSAPVIEDAKKIMKIRTQELRENPYKRLITPQNCSEFWDTLDMFKKAA